MTAAVLVSPVATRGHEASDAPCQPALFDLDGDPMTLDEVMSNAWEGLAASGTAACPVCGERLVARRAPATGAWEGRCRGCGSVLS